MRRERFGPARGEGVRCALFGRAAAARAGQSERRRRAREEKGRGKDIGNANFSLWRSCALKWQQTIHRALSQKHSGPQCSAETLRQVGREREGKKARRTSGRADEPGQPRRCPPSVIPRQCAARESASPLYTIARKRRPVRLRRTGRERGRGKGQREEASKKTRKTLSFAMAAAALSVPRCLCQRAYGPARLPLRPRGRPWRRKGLSAERKGGESDAGRARGSQGRPIAAFGGKLQLPARPAVFSAASVPRVFLRKGV